MAQNRLAARVQTIHCAGYEFLVHRNLVCSSSSYFDAACRGPQESATNEIRLPEGELNAINRMISWIYTEEYDDANIGLNSREDSENSLESPQDEIQTNCQKILKNVEVYALAQRYGIPGLDDLAKSKIRNQMDCNLTQKEFQEIVVAIYNSRPQQDRGLRDIVLALCAEQMDVDYGDASWEPIMRANGDLAYDVLTGTMQKQKQRFAEEAQGSDEETIEEPTEELTEEPTEEPIEERTENSETESDFYRSPRPNKRRRLGCTDMTGGKLGSIGDLLEVSG